MFKRPTESSSQALHGVDSTAQILPSQEYNGVDIKVSTSAFDTAYNIILYKRRFVVLGLFILYSMSNAFQWIQFSIISNIIETYYDVSAKSVEWTSMIYMILYIPLIFPASWFLERKGLRQSVLLGCFGTAAGGWLKCLAVNRDRFWLLFVGQSVVAASQAFVLGIPSHLAALWFGRSEVSTACAVGVFGNQLGIALGFLLPPMLVPSFPDKPTAESYDAVRQGLLLMSVSVSSIISLVFVIICAVFRDRPLTPPSPAEALAQLQSKDDDHSLEAYADSMRRLVRNRNYILLLGSYGMNVGVFYAISTLLNPMFLEYFKGMEEDAGRIGLTIVVAGMFGSVVCGFFLDRTHQFKETTVLLYALSLTGMFGFTFILTTKTLWAVYLVSGGLGFFMTGYLAIGFEFAAELTYPESEGTTSGLLNASAQVFGLIFTNAASTILQNHGTQASNLFLSAVLIIGVIVTFLISSDLRRQAAQNQTFCVNKLPVVSTIN